MTEDLPPLGISRSTVNLTHQELATEGYLSDPIPNNVLRLGLSGIPTPDIEPASVQGVPG